PWSPLARGLLAGTRTSAGDAESTLRAESDDFARRLYDHPSDWKVVEVVREIAQEAGCEPAQIALAWLLSKRAVAAPIIGATKMRHLDSAIEAVEVALSVEQIARLEAPYQPHAVRGF
ncbi:MAG TPA: aldo/keto reductase, partial [Thermoanaerobaculia bacterium]|nr:aldo/keto reductase [Thermoanaerobaculia bacterium]